MKYKYYTLVFILLLCFKGYSQITSSAADYSEETEYSNNDFVFIFCTEDTNGGELRALDSTGYGGYDFKWYKFNEGSQDFTDILSGFFINDDSTYSSITGLSTGGYKAILTNADTTQEYVAWVFNNLGRTVEIKFDPNNDCDFLWMQTEPYLQRGQLFETNLNYFDTITDEFTNLKNSIEQYLWESSPTEDDFRKNNAPFASIVEDPTDDEPEIPVENTTFEVTVIDRFGCSVENEIDYTAIETDANLSWEILEEEGKSGTRESELTGSAPLQVKFTNTSKNAVKYTWFFGDTLWTNDVDTIITNDISLEPEHTYYYYYTPDSGQYTLKLYSESEYGCTDSLLFNINIEPSKIEFPNVFTPNGDGSNDLFIITEDKYKSIRSFKITIFNRVGQLVHEYEGDIRDWKGWAGKVKNSDRDASEGTYFFVFEVLGWDNEEYNNKTMKDVQGEATQGENGEPQQTGESKVQFGTLRLFR